MSLRTMGALLRRLLLTLACIAGARTGARPVAAVAVGGGIAEGPLTKDRVSLEVGARGYRAAPIRTLKEGRKPPPLHGRRHPRRGLQQQHDGEQRLPAADPDGYAPAAVTAGSNNSSDAANESNASNSAAGAGGGGVYDPMNIRASVRETTAAWKEVGLLRGALLGVGQLGGGGSTPQHIAESEVAHPGINETTAEMETEAREASKQGQDIASIISASNPIPGRTFNPKLITPNPTP